MNKTVGIYVHIPFCLRKCFYCDFCSSASDRQTQEAYIKALLRELDEAEPCARPVNTLFIGGGTPSILPPSDIEAVLNAIARKYAIAQGCEVTLEANPATVTKEKAVAYRSLGITRVSIGAQSFCDTELRAIGRLHSAKDVYECVEIFRRAGHDNLNLDLMYGIPYQTVDSFCRTLTAVAELSPAHFSAYGLILEEGSALFQKKDELVFPDADEERAMYDAVCRFAADRGYRHYEISNYAKEGYESRHNLRYWKKEDYLAFGLAAHATVGALRYVHTDSLSEYLAGGHALRVSERLTQQDRDAERVMLGLRTADGVPEELLFRVAGAEKRSFLARCEKEGYLIRKDGYLALTDSGMYVSNAILEEILPDSFFLK